MHKQTETIFTDIFRAIEVRQFVQSYHFSKLCEPLREAGFSRNCSVKCSHCNTEVEETRLQALTIWSVACLFLHLIAGQLCYLQNI